MLRNLKRKGVSKYLSWQEYRQQHIDGYGNSQFCFHLQQQQLASERSMVLDHKPAKRLYIDFAGKKLHYVDKSTGVLIECQVFVACLPFSDYCFAMAVPSRSTEDFLYDLSRCLHHLGGVPLALVPDNLKTAVVKANHLMSRVSFEVYMICLYNLIKSKFI